VKSVSPLARATIIAASAAAFVLYLVILDLGVNAGRIHRGVSVGDVEVGGMTQAEAVGYLAEVGREMRNESITFVTEDLEFHVLPADLNWWPYAEDSARRAMAVGRSGSVAHAASQRWRAWLSGVTVTWEQAGDRRVVEKINELSSELAAAGHQLDEAAMRKVLHAAIWAWPRRDAYEIPLEE
jgi:hypothetical protein